MGRKRNNVVKGDFERWDTDGAMLDCVTLGTKEIVVDQENGEAPPYAWVKSSRVINRDPAQQDEEAAMLRALNWAARPHIHDVPRGKKYCSCCTEWVDRLEFGEDNRYRDGLRSHCRSCEARHARRHYWLMKEARRMAA